MSRQLTRADLARDVAGPTLGLCTAAAFTIARHFSL